MTLRQWSSYQADLHARAVKDGQTGYDVGDPGIWYGTDTDGIFKLSMGDPAGNKITWNGSSLSITGILNLSNTTQTFTPTWSGFSVAPTGDVSYIYFGAYVVMWTKAALTGTSNSDGFSITNLPNAAKPPSYAGGICQVVNNGVTVLGGWQRNGLSSLEFTLFNVATGAFDATAFTNPGTNGIPSGWLLMFPF